MTVSNGLFEKKKKTGERRKTTLYGKTEENHLMV